MTAAAIQGLSTITFQPPSTGAGVWYRQNIRGKGLILLEGMRPSYRVRILFKDSPPVEWDLALFDGAQINAQFDALEWQFGDTTSAPAAIPIKLAIVQQKNAAWVAPTLMPSVPTTRVASCTNGTATVLANATGVTLFDDAADTVFVPGTYKPFNFQRQLRHETYMVGHVGNLQGTFDVYLLAYSNVNSPGANEPFVVHVWTAVAFVPPAGVHADASHWAWTTQQANNLGTLQHGGMRWPPGGGKLVAYNNSGGTINLQYNLSLLSA